MMTDREKQEQFNKELDRWLETVPDEQQESEGISPLAGTEFNCMLKDYIKELMGNAQRKQQLAEDIQSRLNDYCREMERALEAQKAAEEKLKELEEAGKERERMLQGYEEQFSRVDEERNALLQELNSAREIQASLQSQLEEAQKNNAELSNQMNNLRNNLSKAKQYGADMAVKVGEMENTWGAKLRRVLKH